MDPIFNLNYFQYNIGQIELLIVSLTFLATSFLGLLVFLRNPKSWTSRLFGLLAIVLDGYIITNFFSLHPPYNSTDTQLFWIRMVMFFASFKGPIIFLIVYNFPSDQLKIKAKYLSIVVFLAASSAIASLSPLVFKSIRYVGNQPIPIPGPGIFIFFANFVGFILLSFIIMVLKYRRSKGEEKSQQFYLMWGIFISLALIGITSLVFVVILKSSTFVFLGPLFLVILLAAIAYAIVKHQLFNVKIIATNLLVGTILITLLAKVFVSDSIIELAANIIVFGLVMIFGALLVKSVKKEVEQRQYLEKLSKDLENANTKLKELNKLKSEFLSFASHQVKAPMSVVKGYATLIFDGTYGEVSEKVRETAFKIKDAADRMIALVNNLLDLRKIEEGKMDFKFEETDAFKLITDTVNELKPLADNKGLELSTDIKGEKAICSADPQKLRQVFQNLVDNAIKYTDKGWIKVKAEIKDKLVVISVADSGHGIPKDLLPQLFEQFVRDGNEVKKIEGTGLGLYIAKQIVQNHKGKIWAESPGPGQGSIFYVELSLI